MKAKKKPDYTDVFSAVICKMAAKNENIVAVTAAMADGTGLKRFRNEYPGRFFDVGIAEGHAVTFSAGMAAAGLHPVFAVYSSFLQRAFDEIVHDVCIQKLPVIFAIDRAGLVGADGETHQGIMDLSYLSLIPNMTVMAPKNKWELADMFWFASRFDGPVAIRYPRGQAYDGLRTFRSPVVYGKSEWLYEESRVAVFAVGNMVEQACKVRELLHQKGYRCSVINARFVKPVDGEAVRKAAENHSLIVTMEENLLHGGYGDAVGECLADIDKDIAILRFGIRDQFVPHGSVAELQKRVGLDPEDVAEKIAEVLG